MDDGDKGVLSPNHRFISSRVIILLLLVIVERECVQLLEVKEFSKRHVQRACDLVQVHDAGVLRSAVDDIVDRRLAHVAHPGELIDRDPALFAQAADAPRIDFTIYHVENSHTIIVTRIRLIQ